MSPQTNPYAKLLRITGYVALLLLMLFVGVLIATAQEQPADRKVVRLHSPVARAT